MGMNNLVRLGGNHFGGIAVALILMAANLAGCGKPAATTSEARPVRTVTVEGGAQGETVSLTGQVRAKDEVSLAFRIDGRMPAILAI